MTKSNSRWMLRGAVAVTTLVLLPALAAPALAKPVGCREAIIKASKALTRTRLLLLQQCEEQIVAGRRPVATDCRTDTRVAAKIAKAKQRLRATIAAKCGGKNKQCNRTDSGTAADDPLDTLGWTMAACPDLEGAGCTNAIRDCGDVAECLVCTADAPPDRALRLPYDRLVLPSVKSHKKLNRCQRTIGRETARYFAVRARALESCWTAVNRGRRGFGMPCPAGDPKGGTFRRMKSAEQRMVTRICSACGGVDRLCGGGGDFSPAEIGFAAECPAVTAPGGASCGGAVQTLADLVGCLECVSRFQVDCLDALTVPWSGPYPAECNPRCGNGYREGVEVCDGNDSAACPGRCRVDCTCPLGPTPAPTPGPLPSCPATPLTSCQRPALPAEALLVLTNALDDSRDLLIWKWLRGTQTLSADFGNPVMPNAASYQLCIYDGSGGVPTLRLDTHIPAGGTCGDRRLAPCWKKTRWGFKYTDRALARGGLRSIDLREGLDGDAKIVVRGKGPNLPLPDIATLAPPLTVQLANSGGACWEATYGLPPAKHTPEEYRAKAD